MTAVPGPGERAQQVAQLDPAARVEPAGRLVEQQHLGVVHERAGEPEPLLLAAGHGVHRPPGPVRAGR
jgi:hypothetical protein